MSSNSKHFVEVVKEARTEVQKAEAILEKKREFLESLQENCIHNMEYEGHGHNDSYYVCSVCGYEEFR